MLNIQRTTQPFCQYNLVCYELRKIRFGKFMASVVRMTGLRRFSHHVSVPKCGSPSLSMSMTMLNHRNLRHDTFELVVTKPAFINVIAFFSPISWTSSLSPRTAPIVKKMLNQKYQLK